MMERELGPKARRSMRAHFVLRDLLMAYLPRLVVSPALVRRAYGFVPRFVFLTHPRNVSDIYRAIPVLKVLRRLMSEEFLLRCLRICPCYALATVTSPSGINGLILTTTLLPTELVSNQVSALRLSARILRFVDKLSAKTVYVSLGGWWPIVTDGGRRCIPFTSQAKHVVVTSGHCLTLLSICSTVQRLAKLADLEIEEVSLLVIGVGRMGTEVVKAFNGVADRIGFVDIDSLRMNGLHYELSKERTRTALQPMVILGKDFESELLRVIDNYHIVVCTTSNYRKLIQESNRLQNCLIIDDARPEAFPRVVSAERGVAVLEGGLIRIDGAQVSHDFGFGRDQDVFGCLAEGFVLALDSGRSLRPTIGEIDKENLERTRAFCNEHGIGEGRLKSGGCVVPAGVLQDIMNCKAGRLRSGFESKGQPLKAV